MDKVEQEHQSRRGVRWPLLVRIAAAVCAVAAALAIVGVVPSYDGFGRHMLLPEVSGDAVVGLAFIASGTGVIRSGRRRSRPRVPSRGPAA